MFFGVSMPKFRSIHTKIVQSFDFNEMPDDFTRLVWVLLPLGLDNEGRGIYDFSWIKSKIFPLRKDISEKKLLKSMDWLFSRKNKENNLGMIEIYSVDGREYFYVPNFKTYQRGFEKEAPSILPAPSSNTKSIPTLDQLLTNSPLNTQSECSDVSQSETDAEVEVEVFDNNASAWVSEDMINDFEKASHIVRPTDQKELGNWLTTLSEMQALGVDQSIMTLACKELTAAGTYKIVAPKSIYKACKFIIERRARKGDRLLDSEGDFGDFINH
jgi:hypothetical protein